MWQYQSLDLSSSSLWFRFVEMRASCPTGLAACLSGLHGSACDVANTWDMAGCFSSIDLHLPIWQGTRKMFNNGIAAY